jgi:primary-amine oxidase
MPGYTKSETLSDPVIWIGTTWHHVPRAEDKDNATIHWQGITLAPRDYSGTSPLL